MESCGMNVIKYLLFIFNLIFAISGVGIIAAGAVVIADIEEYNHFLESRILAPPIVLIVAGAIVFIVAFLGCFGAIRESHAMLMTFAVCLFIIFIIELAVGIAAAVFINDFEAAMSNTFKKSMSNYSTNDNEKMAWDNVQTKLKCCGVDGPQDWRGTIPYSCCQETPEENQLPNTYCAGSQKSTNYLSQMGCYQKLHMKANANAKILIGVGISIAFIEVVGIVLACWLAAVIKKENSEDK